VRYEIQFIVASCAYHEVQQQNASSCHADDDRLNFASYGIFEIRCLYASVKEVETR